MRIKASTVEAHQFGMVRRRGYDSAEVDAVMERLVDTLREYEHITSDLQSRLKEADESSEAIRRTFLSAQQTRDEMLAEANDLAASARSDADSYATTQRAEADELLSSATSRAAEIGAEAEQQATASATEAESLLALSRTEAARISEEAALDAEQRIAAATAEANAIATYGREDGEALVAGAIEETRRLREQAKMESEAMLAEADADAKQRIADAQSRAANVVAESEQRAHEIISVARAEEEELNARLGRLRSAVADIERELEKLASVSLERASFVGEVIDLESESAHIVVDAGQKPSTRRTKRSGRRVTSDTASTETASSGSAAALRNEREPSIEPMVAVMAVRRGRAFADPDGSGTPPAERRMVDPEDIASKQDGGSTYYERHINLKDRITRAEQDGDS